MHDHENMRSKRKDDKQMNHIKRKPGKWNPTSSDTNRDVISTEDG